MCLKVVEWSYCCRMCRNIGLGGRFEEEMLYVLQHFGSAEAKLPKLVYVLQQFEQVWGCGRSCGCCVGAFEKIYNGCNR